MTKTDSPAATAAINQAHRTEKLTPNLVFFSSVSENTRRFVDKLGFDAARIPLRPSVDGMLVVNQPYVLIVPTYGGGNPKAAIPKQVRSFLNIPENRALLRGVITSGNTNFGDAFCSAGPMIADKCGIPELYRFELLGTQRDVEVVCTGLKKFFSQHLYP